MSGSTALATVLGVGSAVVQAIIAPVRMIGPIIPGIVMEERHTDSLTITSHPVQQGSNISDHAYFEPPMVVVRASWSDASIQAVGSLLSGGDILGTLTDGLFGSQSYSAQIYQQVLSLMYSLTPMNVITGKRIYQNMLIQNLTEVTTRETEYCLILDIACKYVNIVTTASTTLPPPTQQANPQQTDSPQNAGTQSAAPSDNSILRSAGNSAGITTPNDPNSNATGGQVLGVLGNAIKGAF